MIPCWATFTHPGELTGFVLLRVPSRPSCFRLGLRIERRSPANSVKQGHRHSSHPSFPAIYAQKHERTRRNTKENSLDKTAMRLHGNSAHKTCPANFFTVPVSARTRSPSSSVLAFLRVPSRPSCFRTEDPSRAGKANVSPPGNTLIVTD